MHHGVIFVLSNTVVRVQMNAFLSKTVCLEEMVQQRNNCVRSLAHIVNQIVDLTRNSLTANPKYPTLAGCEKVDWAGLLRMWDNEPAVQNQKNSSHRCHYSLVSGYRQA